MTLSSIVNVVADAICVAVLIIFGPKIPVFWQNFYSVEWGGTTTPLMENHSAQKILEEVGGTPHPPSWKKIR